MRLIPTQFPISLLLFATNKLGAQHVLLSLLAKILFFNIQVHLQRTFLFVNTILFSLCCIRCSLGTLRITAGPNIHMVLPSSENSHFSPNLQTALWCPHCFVLRPAVASVAKPSASYPFWWAYIQSFSNFILRINNVSSAAVNVWDQVYCNACGSLHD